MTVVDFRSGGYDDARGVHGRGQPDSSYRPHEWDAEDWDEAQRAELAEARRLSDRDSVLGRVARLTHYLGALVSVVLMISLMVWGYQLVVRDVSGVPVIRAVAGEARIAPDEPGGMLSDRSGLAVNDVAAGTESAPVEQVAIAPAPTALDGQDVAMGKLGASARAATVTDDVAEEAAAPVLAVSDAEVARLARAEAEAAQAAAVPVVPAADADAVSVAAAVTDANGQPTMDTAITAALAEAGAASSVVTPSRPAPRPRRLAAVAAMPVVTSVADAAPAEAAPVAASPVAPGAPLVQIGAFDSDAIAHSEWNRVSGRYGDLFAGKAPVVQQHRAGGRTFYRLRIAGFETRDDARKFCAALIAAGNDCIPAAAQ